MITKKIEAKTVNGVVKIVIRYKFAGITIYKKEVLMTNEAINYGLRDFL